MKDFWNKLAIDIEQYCNQHSIKHTNFFYHEKLVEHKKKEGRTL